MHNKPAPEEASPTRPPVRSTAAPRDEKLTPNEILSEIFGSLGKFILLFLLGGFVFVGTCIPAGISAGLDNANSKAPLESAVVTVVISLLAALWLFRKSPIRGILMLLLLALGIAFVAFIALSF